MDFSPFINAHKRNRFSFSPLIRLLTALVDRMAPNDATTWIKIEHNALRSQICIRCTHITWVKRMERIDFCCSGCLNSFASFVRSLARAVVLIYSISDEILNTHIRLMSDGITINRAHYYYPCVRYARFQVLRKIVFHNAFANWWRMTVKLEHQPEPTNDDTIFVSIRWFQW